MASVPQTGWSKTLRRLSMNVILELSVLKVCSCCTEVNMSHLRVSTEGGSPGTFPVLQNKWPASAQETPWGRMTVARRVVLVGWSGKVGSLRRLVERLDSPGPLHGLQTKHETGRDNKIKTGKEKNEEAKNTCCHSAGNNELATSGSEARV